MTTLGIICGGPSEERGISLNSARSLYDHLASTQINFNIFYVDTNRKFFKIDVANLYSNTPSDFDYKLSQSTKALNEDALTRSIQSCDIIFPCIHGEYGEDGELQSMLEKLGMPYVGSLSESCKKALDKWQINKTLIENNLPVFKMHCISANEKNMAEKINCFLQENNGFAVLKPQSSGSSIGVKVINHVDEAIEHINHLKAETAIENILIEEYSDGNEFTVLVMQGEDDTIAALPTTEIIFDKKSPKDIFDYRRKYLPTNDTRRACPPINVSNTLEAEIRNKAEQVFKLFNLRDIGRIDGFITKNNDIIFTDINPLGGMEQNSFIFQQASRIGLTHKDILIHLVNRALSRANKPLIKQAMPNNNHKKNVFVLMGGNTAERQVSVMSGTNVWLKLKDSNKYNSIPFIIDDETIWQLPYGFCLDHTTEEIIDNCETANQYNKYINELGSSIREKLGFSELNNFWELPKKFTRHSFYKYAQTSNNAFVFIALHGGFGEDGRLQTELDSHKLHYNGSASEGAKLCMDKWKTGEAIEKANIQGLSTCKRFNITNIHTLNENPEAAKKIWEEATEYLDNKTLIAKPIIDGCSAGIVPLVSCDEFNHYISLAVKGGTTDPRQFTKVNGLIDMHFNISDGIMLEPFIETVALSIVKDQIKPEKVEGWIELTVGITQQADSKQLQCTALEPSITVAKSGVLSLEEKFQGGTGVNLTPPIETIVSKQQRNIIKDKVEQTAELLGIRGYARIDIFFNTITNEVIIIEANALPGLTPSTVIYHQALAAIPSRTPREFLEYLIENKYA